MFHNRMIRERCRFHPGLDRVGRHLVCEAARAATFPIPGRFIPYDRGGAGVYADPADSERSSGNHADPASAGR